MNEGNIPLKKTSPIKLFIYIILPLIACLIVLNVTGNTYSFLQGSPSIFSGQSIQITPLSPPDAPVDLTTSKIIKDKLIFVGAEDVFYYPNTREVWIYITSKTKPEYSNGNIVYHPDQELNAKMIFYSMPSLVTDCLGSGCTAYQRKSNVASIIDTITITVISSESDVYGNIHSSQIMQVRRSSKGAQEINWANLFSYKDPIEALHTNFDFVWGA